MRSIKQANVANIGWGVSTRWRQIDKYLMIVIVRIVSYCIKIHFENGGGVNEFLRILHAWPISLGEMRGKFPVERRGLARWKCATRKTIGFPWKTSTTGKCALRDGSRTYKRTLCIIINSSRLYLDANSVFQKNTGKRLYSGVGKYES